MLLDGEPLKVQVFSMRSMYSGAAFHVAYWRATQQALFEAHELAFIYFEEVCTTIRYDSMAQLVKMHVIVSLEYRVRLLADSSG